MKHKHNKQHSNTLFARCLSARWLLVCVVQRCADHGRSACITDVRRKDDRGATHTYDELLAKAKSAVHCSITLTRTGRQVDP